MSALDIMTMGIMKILTVLMIFPIVWSTCPNLPPQGPVIAHGNKLSVLLKLTLIIITPLNPQSTPGPVSMLQDIVQPVMSVPALSRNGVKRTVIGNIYCLNTLNTLHLPLFS